MKRNKLTQKRLKELLHYDPDTGIWTWRVDRGYKKTAGQRTGKAHAHNPYRRIFIDGKAYKCCRLAWLYVYGEWPKNAIDHINGIQTDDRINNLRDAGKYDNQRNARLYKNNTSGVPGVIWHNRDNCYEACIYIKPKRIYLGRFTKKRDAVAARKAAERLYGFHQNHGKRR